MEIFVNDRNIGNADTGIFSRKMIFSGYKYLTGGELHNKQQFKEHKMKKGIFIGLVFGIVTTSVF
jgi:hypothetical protein